MNASPTYIKRDIYINRISPYFNKNLIKVIVGQRRVGKSCFLLQIIDEIKALNKKANIIYINKELHEFDKMNNYNDLHDYVKEKSFKSKKNYLFIDEIQDIQQFEKALRSFQAEGIYDIYCTGSNANLLSGELSTYLSGRYVETKIYGLSYNEFLQFHSLKHTEDSFNKFIKFGGMPYLINLPLEENVIYEYLKNIYSAILFKDIVARHNIRNVNFLENLVTYLGDNIGSIVSAKKISDFLKSQKINITPNQVLDYLNYLVSAFFIFKVKRSEIGGKKIFEIGDKYYFEDLGLRNTIVGYKTNDINKTLENLVYLQMAIKGYNITVGKMKEKEIDFVCQKDSEKIYIQVTYLLNDEKVIKREFDNLLAINDNYKKIVVSMDKSIGKDYEGIEHWNIYNFLMNF